MIREGFTSLKNCNDCAYAKSETNYAAYKDYPSIARFFTQFNNKGDVIALISIIDSYINLTANEINDELICFIKSLPHKGIFTNLDSAQSLNLKIKEQCIVFVKKPPFETCSLKQEYKEAGEILSLLKNGIEIKDEDGFIADLSFRFLKGFAKYATNEMGAALLFTGNEKAVLSGIAVKEKARGMGIGKSLLRSLLSEVSLKVFACSSDKNKKFYIKNGFIEVEKACYCEELK